jgi:hypothetical protein
LVLALLFVPALAYAQPPLETPEGSRWSDPELQFGGALVVSSYATSVLWARESTGDQGALYIPLIGPWLELFNLPDCPDGPTFCAHGNATRSVLIASGVGQAVGVGLLIHAMKKRHTPERVLIAPSVSAKSALVSVRGRF